MSNVTKNSVTTVPIQLQEGELLQHLLRYVIENEYSLALWRLPNDSSTNLIVSFTQNTFSKDHTLEELPEGFLFTPFDTEKPGQFLKADLSLTFNEGRLAEPCNPLQTYSQNKLNDILSIPDTKKIKLYSGKENNLKSSTVQKSFEELVQKGIDEIESGRFEKIVPSRFRLIDLPEDFDCIESFQKLCIAYPNAMVSFVSSPTIGTWIGATPEVLVSVEENHIFKTVALAGTKAFEEGTNLKQVAWTQKEIEEQALVSRYIISCFKKIRLREFEEHGPKTMVAGNLMHLKTDFTVDMNATNFPQLGSVMLKLLHPTLQYVECHLSLLLNF